MATKAIPQLRMIRDIMGAILGSGEVWQNRNSSQPLTVILESLISDIKRAAEETADFFDHQNQQISILSQKILNKE